MKTVIRYLEAYKKEVVLAPLFKLLEAGFELIVPLVVARMIDRGVGGRNPAEIWRGLALLLLFGVVGFVCAVTAQYFAAKAAVYAAAGMRSDMLKRITSLSFMQMDQISESTFMTRMTSDINQVQTTINMVLRLFLRSPFIVFGAVIMAFSIDRFVSTAFIVTVALLSLTVFFILRVTMPSYQDIQRQLDDLTLIVQENLSGVRVIRAFNGQTAQKELFFAKNRKMAASQRAVGRISSLMNPATTILINLGIVAVLYAGGVQVQGKVLSQGEVVALVNYMSQILVELLKLAAFIISVSKGIACAGRIKDVLTLPPEKHRVKERKEDEAAQKTGADAEEPYRASGVPPVLDGSGDGPYVASMDGVTFSYFSGAPDAVSDIGIHVARGETVGILGGTGAGKSTLLQLLTGFYTPDRGEVELFGRRMEIENRYSLLAGVGIVPQKATLFDGTLEDNLRWGDPNASQERMWEALRIAQADGFVREKGGLSLQVDEGGRNFSGGQRQRLTIARALVRRPELLLLDDSFSALDYATDARLRLALADSALVDATVIFSQRVSTLMGADRIYVLDDGRIVGEGRHDKLLSKCRLYREIYQSQVGERGADHGK